MQNGVRALCQPRAQTAPAAQKCLFAGRQASSVAASSSHVRVHDVPVLNVQNVKTVLIKTK